MSVYTFSSNIVIFRILLSPISYILPPNQLAIGFPILISDKDFSNVIYPPPIIDSLSTILKDIKSPGLP